MAETTNGILLPEHVLQKTIEACDRALTLDFTKKKVFDFVESGMGYIAPNLSAIAGSAVAAKLMGTAGGLSALANIPACNVQLLGEEKKNIASRIRIGCIEETEIYRSMPPSLRARACRLIAAKSTLAARLDSTGSGNAAAGMALLEGIHKKIDKWQERPLARQIKPLPVPRVSEGKKKRGGRRLRKMKERYAVMETRKLVNRMQFGVAEDSSLLRGGYFCS